MICVDNNFLVLLFYPEMQTPPIDVNTGLPVDRIRERIEFLQENWRGNHETILLPDPVLTEFLIFADEDRNHYLHTFQNSPNFSIKPFDTRCAIELAAMYIKEKSTLSVRKREAFTQIDTKTRLKFDRQIVAIAQVNNATAIYSDDRGVKAFADLHGIPVIRIFELPLPPEPEPEAQTSLFNLLEESDGIETKTANVVSIETHRAQKTEVELNISDSEPDEPFTNIDENKKSHQ